MNTYDEFIIKLYLLENNIDCEITKNEFIIYSDLQEEELLNLLEKSKRKKRVAMVKSNISGSGKRSKAKRNKLVVICPTGQKRKNSKSRSCVPIKQEEKKSNRKREKTKRRNKNKGQQKRNRAIGADKRRK